MKGQVQSVGAKTDPTDGVCDERTNAAGGLGTKVYPTYRPDAALRIDEPTEFKAWLGKLRQVADVEVRTFDDLLAALKKRLHDNLERTD